MQILNSLLFIMIFFPAVYSMERAYDQFDGSSVWGQLAHNIPLNRNDRLRFFQQDCLRIGANLPLPVPHHQINDHTVRIATYNVHYWTDPFQRPNFDNILAVIQRINADILILQEVSWGVSRFNNRTTEQIKEAFRGLGYRHFFFGQAAHFHQAPFGNVIISKYPFVRVPRSTVFQHLPVNNERRCLLHGVISLPHNHEISVYGTHLDVHDATGVVRRNQIQECIDLMNHDERANVLIAADFNEVREQDYEHHVWDLLRRDNLRRNDPTPTNVARLLTEAQFVDCFRAIGIPSPRFTVWNGTIVDFIYLKRYTWVLPLIGCYAYYDAASDHIPIIFDVAV